MAHFQDTVLPNPTRFERSLHLSALLTLLLLLAGGGTAQAQDGRTILLKTRKAYQALNSYSGEAAVALTIRTQQGGAFTGKSSSTMSFQRPNKIHILVASTHSSRNIYSDGTTMSSYDLATNQYHTVPMAGKQGDLLALLAREDVTSNLDPLYFLCGKSLPQDLTNIQRKEAAAYLGDHPVYIITGTIRTPTGKSSSTIHLGPTSSWTWWIDRQSFLIYQVETTTPNSTVGNFNGVLTIRHSVVKLQSNPVIPASEFDFTPPPNAARKKP
ncbi:MAG: putative periplasmic protein [Chthonomonadales bacterium]|nr:putative periplasmic protein [Chthonomonadales bacterium]